MKLEKWQPVSITWLDAWTDYEGCASRDFEREYKRAIRRTIGWVIHSDKDRIVVAMEDDRLHGEAADCQTVTTIPTSIIEKVELLRPVPTPRRKKNG